MDFETTISATSIEEEKEVILRSQSDPRAFGVLYEKYFKKIFLFILHRVEEKQVAADIAQEVFVKALSGIKKFEFRGLPFSSWLYRIAINECHELFRKSGKMRVVTLENESAKNLHEELADVFQHDLIEKLPLVLERLKPSEVTLIELRFFESRSFREIGEITDMTEVNAKVSTYRILAKMKKLLVP